MIVHFVIIFLVKPPIETPYKALNNATFLVIFVKIANGLSLKK